MLFFICFDFYESIHSNYHEQYLFFFNPLSFFFFLKKAFLINISFYWSQKNSSYSTDLFEILIRDIYSVYLTIVEQLLNIL